MRRAFTLIELLVVIAIIAILAAILFPVFAQAKESAKKTESLSNTKQTGQAIQMYLPDYNDSYPMAQGVENDGSVSVARWNGYPAGWDSAVYEFGDSTVWGNSIQPYMKNMKLTEAPGVPYVQMTAVFGAAAYANPRKQPGSDCLVMNGLLHTYNATAITEPAELVVLWYGFGRENLVGGINMEPSLNCGLVKECRFNPGGLPAATTYTGNTTRGDIFWVSYSSPTNDTVWIYHKGMNMARADSSAKHYKLGGAPNVTITNKKDPFLTYGGQGDYWLTVQRCASGNSGVYYSSFFRPDAEFRHTSSTTGNCFP